MRDEGDALAVARARVSAEAAAVAAVGSSLDGGFLRIAAVVLASRGKIFVGGSGTSGTVAARMAHVLSVTGTPAVSFSPMDALHGASGAMTAVDLVLLISNGGNSQEVLDVARIAAGRGAAVIALTGSARSPLAVLADHVAVVSAPDAAQIGGVVATGITLAQSVWGDALAETVMRARGYTWQQFMTTHPAGAVGRLEDLPPDLGPVTLPTVDAGGAP